jgi:hypothetical protein
LSGSPRFARSVARCELEAAFVDEPGDFCAAVAAPDSVF